MASAEDRGKGAPAAAGRAVLDGIRVLDFGRYVAAPFCGQILADMGAEVIRVERPGGEDDRKRAPFAPSGESLYVIALNRNKKGITLNLRSPRGKELVRELVGQSDVVLQNFSMGAARAAGLDYPTLREVNRRIIVASISGFGWSGPYARRLAFDAIAQALSAAMSVTGHPGSPPTLSAMPYVDFATGLYTALAIVLALYHRERSGEGQAIDQALLDTAVSFSAAYGIMAEVAVNHVVRGAYGNQTIYAFGDAFRCRDGWVMVCVISEGLWRNLCRMIGREELAADPRYRSDLDRWENREALLAPVAAWMAERTVAEVVEACERAAVPCGRVNNAGEVAGDPQVKARELVVAVDQPGLGAVPVPGSALKLGLTPGRVRRRAPGVGEHNREIYGELLGLSDAELEQLAAERVI